MSNVRWLAGPALLVVLFANAAQAQTAPARGQAQAVAPSGPIVTLKQGQLQGLVNDDVNIDRGIPYAAPPVGALRWRPPQPGPSWQGVRLATAAGASCATAEDCLFLNVFRPLSAKTTDKLPVMVWIHGGAFTGGTGASYDASAFAKQGIVVFTINYRLGKAGWFAHPALTKESPNGPLANYGLMDQIAALKWVKDNAGAFGGDPSNVTVFGESAGAISINFLMISPEAKGLFNKAISESGFGRYSATPLATAERTSVAAIPSVTGEGPEAAAALRALPLSALGPRGGLGSIGPILDGKIVTTSIADGFAKGLEAKVPFLLGGNSNEASLFAAQMVDPAARLAAITTNRDAFLAAFDDDKTGDPARIISRQVTVQEITEPDRNLARQHVKNGQPTFVYYFSYVPMAQRATSLGVSHGGEILYVFDYGRGDAEGQAVAKSANAYWGAFAKTSNPGTAGGPQWPVFTAAQETVLEFGPGAPVAHDHLLKARLDWVEANRAQTGRGGGPR